MVSRSITIHSSKFQLYSIIEKAKLLEFFRNAPHYQQPLVPVRLSLEPNTNVRVQCAAWADKLEQNEKDGYGMIKFTIAAQP